MHINISQEPLCTEIYKKNAAAQNLGPHFVRAAIGMHLEISQEPQENAAAQLEHLDQAPAFTATVRTPQCGHTVWRNTHK
jgi:hypothetical protein